MAYYCSAEHMEADKERHKKECEEMSSYMMDSDSECSDLDGNSDNGDDDGEEKADADEAKDACVGMKKAAVDETEDEKAGDKMAGDEKGGVER